VTRRRVLGLPQRKGRVTRRRMDAPGPVPVIGEKYYNTSTIGYSVGNVMSVGPTIPLAYPPTLTLALNQSLMVVDGLD
jgi:hypothetical protein